MHSVIIVHPLLLGPDVTGRSWDKKESGLWGLESTSQHCDPNLLHCDQPSHLTSFDLNFLPFKMKTLEKTL